MSDVAPRGRPGEPSSVSASGLDLLLGGRCSGCDAPGRVLCEACGSALPREAVPHEVGGRRVFACGPYAGLLQALVIGHKERGVEALRPVLADLLALAVAEVLGEAAAGAEWPPAPVVLVPVPSRRAAVRARGGDPTHEMVAAAARRLTGAGVPARPARLLRSRPGVVDQAGLSAGARAQNLAGSMAGASEALRRLAGSADRAHVVVCDDVATTGSTLAEACRALEAVGIMASGTACVAVTARRRILGETSV